MGEFPTTAQFFNHMPTDQVRQTRTMLEAIVSRVWSAWFKFGSSEEIADLFNRRVALKRHAHRAGDYAELLRDVSEMVGKLKLVGHAPPSW